MYVVDAVPVRRGRAHRDVVLGFVALAAAGDPATFDLVALDSVQHAAVPA